MFVPDKTFQSVILSKASGLYYKHILMIVSDDRKWRQYYKCNWRH